MYARKVTQRRVRVTIVAVEKQEVLNIRSVSVALVIQHAKGMRRIIISSVACLSVRIFFLHYLINSTTSGKKRLLNIKFSSLGGSSPLRAITISQLIRWVSQNTTKLY